MVAVGSTVLITSTIVGPSVISVVSSKAATSKGGTFVERELSDFATLDPLAPSGNNPDLGIETALYDRLVAPGPNGTVVPYVATSWTMSPSAKSITFNLRILRALYLRSDPHGDRYRQLL